MKRTLFILVFSFVSLSSVGIARAEDPFVYISFEQKSVKLRSEVFWNTITPKALTLNVRSNCFHGSVVATMSSLRNPAGGKITQDRVFVKTSSTGGFVPLVKPVAISSPVYGPHNIVVDFMVKGNGPYDNAGQYYGTLVFTVMPAV
ncbi:MAG: hypothetical protein JW787_05360 [Sedimentisphaerales bacterium]|nr:hypothetical protein [Sedimentisphaerales bacterium]